MFKKRNIPNFLTMLRLLAIPLMVLAIYKELYFTAAVIFSLASITDFLDGYLARKWNAISDFGKLMDPIADKILVMSAMVMLVGAKHFINAQSFIPAWIVVLLLARETWVTGLRTLAASRGVVLPAGSLGKIKSFIQMTGIILILLNNFNLNLFGSGYFPASYLGLQLLIASVVFSIWSAVEYSVIVFNNSFEHNTNEKA